MPIMLSIIGMSQDQNKGTELSQSSVVHIVDLAGELWRQSSRSGGVEVCVGVIQQSREGLIDINFQIKAWKAA